MINIKFHANFFCVLLGFNFFPENIVELRFIFNFFMLNYLIFSLSKLPMQLSIFLLNKQPLEELLKIRTMFFLVEVSIGSSFLVELQVFSLWLY